MDDCSLPCETCFGISGSFVPLLDEIPSMRCVVQELVFEFTSPHNLSSDVQEVLIEQQELPPKTSSQAVQISVTAPCARVPVAPEVWSIHSAVIHS